MTKGMDVKVNNITHKSSFPTPMMPPNLVRSVACVICQSEMVCSTTESNLSDNPNTSFEFTNPDCSTLYL